jgi:hypothetical protein
MGEGEGDRGGGRLESCAAQTSAMARARRRSGAVAHRLVLIAAVGNLTAVADS